MEVAGRWRQQWAGAAEYGKMVDDVGGVVRTARAMEVMQASGPGARMRVTRAAYHSTGPLSTSYLLHSSTRTILSSRADALQSPSLVSKPLELSSTPLDAASDSCPEGDEPYKVTEPDDTDISEPSKWRSSIGRRSLRMPSEESSSTDNASLVDSGGRSYFPIGSRRNDSSKTSTSSQSISSAEPKSHRSSFHRKPTSEPLMKISEHAKCLEESSIKTNSSKTRDEWHDRRNSYGFEYSPPNGIKSLSEEYKIVMESSTDSGICKSTEVVNIPISKYESYDVGEHKLAETRTDDQHESFRDWLSKTRSSSAPITDFSSTGRKSREPILINVRSPGKISITLPSSCDRDSEDENKQNVFRKNYDNADKKFKKVEFCKTELHFAAESGKVKIIETDEKPPSTNDFRRRRSAFVPIRDQNERPITLFGGSYLNESSTTEQTYFGNNENGDVADRINNEHDNDSVKSILKNKIPKPKPYLLGEDTEFDKPLSTETNIWGVRLRRMSDDYLDISTTKSPISILNESLKQDNRIVRKHVQEIDHLLNKTPERSSDRDHCNEPSREWKSSPIDYVNLSNLHKETSVASTQTSEDLIYDTIVKIPEFSDLRETQNKESKEKSVNDSNSTNFVHEKLKLLQMSPILQNKSRTRHLRQNELSYFGVNAGNTSSKIKSSGSNPKTTDERSVETALKKIKNVKKSYEPPLYQNLPLNIPLVPVPAPRSTKKLEQQVCNMPFKYSSDESIGQSDDDRDTINGGHIATRVLETINELKMSSQEPSNRSAKILKCQTKHKSNIIRVETPSRRTMNKSNSKESLAHSRESSSEDIPQLSLVKPHTSRSRTRDGSKSSQLQTESTSSIRRTEKSRTGKTKYTQPAQDTECSRVSSKMSDSISKTRSRRNSQESKDSSFQRNYSTDKSSKAIKENNLNEKSPPQEKHYKLADESNLEKFINHSSYDKRFYLRNEVDHHKRSSSKEKHQKLTHESNDNETIHEGTSENKYHLRKENEHRTRSSSKERHSRLTDDSNEERIHRRTPDKRLYSRKDEHVDHHKRSSSKDKHPKLTDESNIENETIHQGTSENKYHPRKENEHRTRSSSKEKHSRLTDDSNEEERINRRSSEKRSHSRKDEHCSQSSSKGKNYTLIDDPNVAKTRTHQSKSNDQSGKSNTRKKEYVLNYDDKKGTLSSVSRGSGRHSNSRKHDRIDSTLEKIYEKPKETIRTSRVTTVQMKNPMMSTKEMQRRTKSADHRSPRRKHKEDPPQ